MSFVEIVIVIAIVGILAALSTTSYRHFTQKAHTAEASMALAEVNRLQELYRFHHGRYTNDLALIGFPGVLTLKHYRIEVQLQNNGAAFQASAIPLNSNQTGSVQVRSSDPLSPVTTPTNPQQTDVGSSSSDNARPSSAPLPCQGGGEATVLSDGALDMNFCYQPPPSRLR
jgi:Tfp pilus assembly protein PilE